MILVFDFDGTLHKSDVTYVPAFEKTVAHLVAEGLMEPREYTAAEIGYWLGYSAAEMWRRFAPGLSEEKRAECSAMLGDEIIRLARAGEARFYDGVEAALDALAAAGHRFVFLSNCHHNYMEVHREALSLDRWFYAYYCCEDFGWPPKADVFPTIVAEHGTSGVAANKEFVVIGDRFHDMGIAREHGVPAVGCAYGFGSAKELEVADVVVSTPGELPAAVKRLAHR